MTRWPCCSAPGSSSCPSVWGGGRTNSATATCFASHLTSSSMSMFCFVYCLQVWLVLLNQKLKKRKENYFSPKFKIFCLIWFFFFISLTNTKYLLMSVNVRSVKVSVNSISKVSLCCRLDDFICKQCWVSMSTVLWAVRGLLLFAFSIYSQDEVNVIVIHIRWGHVLYLSVSLHTIELHPFYKRFSLSIITPKFQSLHLIESHLKKKDL